MATRKNFLLKNIMPYPKLKNKDIYLPALGNVGHAKTILYIQMWNWLMDIKFVSTYQFNCQRIGVLVGSAGLVVMGGDSCPTGREFESQCFIPGRWIIFHISCNKILKLYWCLKRQ